MSAAAKAAADLACVLPMDDPLARVARMALEHMARTELAHNHMEVRDARA